MQNGIKLTVGSYVNADGEAKEFLAIKHPDHGSPVRLLHKKAADREGRMNVEEMVAVLTELTDWRDRLEYVVHEEYGAYFAVSFTTYTDLDI